MRNNNQKKDRKSNHNFEVVGEQELLVRVPLPMAEVWAEMALRLNQRPRKTLGFEIPASRLRATVASTH